MKFTRTQILIIAIVIGGIYVMYKRERYENEKEKENVQDVASQKKLSQKELDAVLKFIKK